MKQKKVFAITAGLLLCILAASAAAAGDAGDPLISLSYLTDIFTDSVDRQVEEKLDQSDAPNFFSMMRAIIPAERSLNAQVKSPTSKNTNSTTNPVKV